MTSVLNQMSEGHWAQVQHKYAYYGYKTVTAFLFGKEFSCDVRIAVLALLVTVFIT